MELSEQEASRSTVAIGAAAALGAAVAGAVAWGLIVRWSEYEVGIVAWAIGWLAGTAAVLGARGARGLPLQVVAVVAALVGVLLGKYLAFAWTLQDALEEELGPEVSELLGAEFGVFSESTREAFRDDLGSVFGWFDLLWVGLAVFTAWRIPAPQSPHPDEPLPSDE